MAGNDELLNGLFDIAIKAHLASGMIKNPNGNFALTDDLLYKLKQLGYIKRPSEQNIRGILAEFTGIDNIRDRLAKAIIEGLGGKK